MSDDREPVEAQVVEPQFDQAQVQMALERMRGEQNLGAGIVAGAAAALVGAGIWAVVTVVTGFQIGWMAVGVGFLVGIAVRLAGKGIDTVFGIVGSFLALLGCALGNLLAVCAMVAQYQDVGFFDVLRVLDFAMVKDMMIASFSPMDVLFYGIAVYEGYKLSFRQVTEQEITERITGQRAAG